MSIRIFEIKSTDLAGRLGRLEINGKSIETPVLLPVVHPIRQTIPPRELKAIGFDAVMTNAYITLREERSRASKIGIHRFIDYEGVVMTDSGGYQVLRYGDIETNPVQMIRFQESIRSDIAVALDVPTGYRTSRGQALTTVNQTIQAAKVTISAKRRDDVLYTGAVQGGPFDDLVTFCAEELARLDFDLYAIGSPTEMMESYRFDALFRLICAAKRRLPVEKPLHLFGVGHPLTLSLAVALGCDMFDSASYMLYAKDGRYITDSGTLRVGDLEYIACTCPTCIRTNPEELKSLDRGPLVDSLARHNLFVLHSEMQRIRQSISEGRLWEHLGIRARAHPSLWKAFRMMGSAFSLIEDGTPVLKSKGLFLSTPPDTDRPEVSRHRTRVLEIMKPRAVKCLILIPIEPSTNLSLQSSVSSRIFKEVQEFVNNIQICFLVPPFEIIPLEILDIYPLSQNVNITENKYGLGFVSLFKKFLRTNRYKNIILCRSGNSPQELEKLIKSASPHCEVCAIPSLRRTVAHVLGH